MIQFIQAGVNLLNLNKIGKVLVKFQILRMADVTHARINYLYIVFKWHCNIYGYFYQKCLYMLYLYIFILLVISETLRNSNI